MKKNVWIYGVSLVSIVMASSCSQHKHKEEIVAQQFVHSYGVEVAGNDWRQRGKNGQVISILDTGEKLTHTYANGLLQGDSTITFPHQEIIERVQSFESGYLIEETVNDSHGTPMHRTRYLGQNHQKINMWYENGSPQSVEEWTNNMLVSGDYYGRNHQVEARIVDGDGTRVNRDHYGLHLSTEQVEDGAVVKKTLFYANGTPKEVIPMQQDVAHGIKKTYLPSGEPQTVEEWVGGSQHGLVTLYRNGEKMAEIPYVEGKKNGIERRYSDGVKVVEEITWKDDERHGLSRTYIASTVKDLWYSRGKLVSKTNYDRIEHPELMGR